jgi:hypothetical protein
MYHISIANGGSPSIKHNQSSHGQLQVLESSHKLFVNTAPWRYYQSMCSAPVISLNCTTISPLDILVFSFFERLVVHQLTKYFRHIKLERNETRGSKNQLLGEIPPCCC